MTVDTLREAEANISSSTFAVTESASRSFPNPGRAVGLPVTWVHQILSTSRCRVAHLHTSLLSVSVASCSESRLSKQ